MGFCAPEPSLADPPFACPPDIVLELPFPTSTNRLHKHLRSHVYLSKEYRDWQKSADAWCLLKHQYPRERITGPFEIEILLDGRRRGDGDNRIKAILDWLQTRQIIRNDSDCVRGSWRWVPFAQAPVGCRITVRAIV